MTFRSGVRQRRLRPRAERSLLVRQQKVGHNAGPVAGEEVDHLELAPLTDHTDFCQRR